MRLSPSLLAAALFTALACAAASEPPAQAIDWTRARDLHQRAQKGETLNAADQAYLDQARAARAGGNRPVNPEGRPNPGRTEGKTALGLKPLTEMTASDSYKGQDGGLYGKGLNTPPPAQAEAALAAGLAIVPLDAAGAPAKEGKIGLIAVGMSNTTREFQEFIAHARADPALAPGVVLVDGAQGGMAGREWAQSAGGPSRQGRSGPWETLDQRIRAAGLTSNQVQAAWIKQAEKAPGQLGDFPAHAHVLATSVAATVRELKARYPRLRLVYLSSRIYAGFAGSALNPEPYAYEGAFAMRQVIQRQMADDPGLGLKANPGMPVLLWGPYLWADGDAGRKSDGLVYRREDFAADGTHPSASGSAKVADMLLDFLKTDPSSRPWFVRGAP